MPNLITRNILDNNFSGLSIQTNDSFTRTDLVKKINLWKYVLKTKCLAEKGESILIGVQTLGLDYLSMIFAAAELSLKIVIIDYNRNDDFKDLEYFDPKTKILSPIDIFLHDFSKELIEQNAKAFSKFIFFSNCSKRTYSTQDDIDFSISNQKEFDNICHIFPDPTDVVMRCTSSGTTGTPKIVEHTHEFLYKVSLRNAYKFSGKCMHVRNLNHGSSLAVYLLPALMSNQVTTNLFYDIDEHEPFDKFIKSINQYEYSLEYIIFPYPFMIDEFIDASRRNGLKWKNLNIQTLSYIQDKSKLAIEDGIIKSITSIFGSNETSGPVFIAYIDKNCTDKDSRYFEKVDDFYTIELLDNGLLNVGLPVYGNEIITNDVFHMTDNFYIHRGRSDLIRINGETLDIKIINEFNLKNKDAYLITDTVKNCLYLAFWNQVDEVLRKEYEQFFKHNYKRIEIKNIMVLDQNKFRTGIKIDNELLREYFRKNV